MPDELTLPAWRPMDPNDLIRQGHGLAAMVAAPRRRGWVRRYALAIGAVTALATTVGAGAAYLQSAPARVHASVYCYTTAGTTAKDLGTQTNYRAGDQNAVSVCAALWQAGVLHAGNDLPTPPTRGAQPSAVPAPPLVACVLHGEVAVFPGSVATCRRLGLPALARSK